MAVNRRDLIERIESLSDEEIERVGPYLEADLDALVDLDELRDEVARAGTTGRGGAPTRSMNMMLDTGATHTVVPEDVLIGLGLRPSGTTPVRTSMHQFSPSSRHKRPSSRSSSRISAERRT